jgi:hypothetical protein
MVIVDELTEYRPYIARIGITKKCIKVRRECAGRHSGKLVYVECLTGNRGLA